MNDSWAEGPFANAILGGQTCRNDDGDGTREEDFTHICVPLAATVSDLFCDDPLQRGQHPSLSVGSIIYSSKILRLLTPLIWI